MMEVPIEAPETTPVVDPMVATDVVPLVHVPPGVASDNDVVPPTHVENEPVIDAGTPGIT